MTHAILRHVKRHPARALLTVGVAVALAVSGAGAARDWARFALFATQAQALARDGVAGPLQRVGWSFEYRGERWSVLVDVPRRTISSARALRTEPVFMSGGALREAYMSTLVRTQADGALVGEVARQLRAYRFARALDDDGYLELITRAVQEIPYGTPRPRVSPPAAFLAEGRGVCTERSVLLAALLLHEGYDTAVWVFDTQAHVAVGVRGVGRGFRDSGYALVETTRASYVGEVGADLAGRATPDREPQLIRLGGARAYRSDIEAQFIVNTLSRTRLSSSALAEFTRSASTVAEPWRREYARRAEQHEQTTRMAAWLESASDDRAGVFALMTGGAGR